MNRLFNYVPLHFLVFCVIGICCQYFTQFLSVYIFQTLFLLSLLTIIFFLVKNGWVRYLVAFGIFFLLGATAVYIKNPKNTKTFYGKYYQQNALLTLKIKELLKPGEFYNKYKVKVIGVNNYKTTGTILLNVKKDSLQNYFNVDDLLLLTPELKELIAPLNPYQFNYKTYLKKQGIHHQVFTDKENILKLKSKHNTLFGWSSKFRNFIKESLKNYCFKENELAVIQALLLGQRQDISKDLLIDYQRAGAIHILAVSGLHVGIILLMLSFLLKPLENIKYGICIKTVLIILFLWMFAFIAGLSASVVRAVTMFIFLALGMAFKQQKMVVFSFITSLFLLLIIHPMFLFDVGFQLSYLAVFGILTMQPKIYEIWKPKYKLVHFFWEIFTVSIAAQIGILPLSIYYFKQFPGLFLISNLVIIPFLGIILGLGLMVIILASVKFLPLFLANFYNEIIFKMNTFISWIGEKEAFLIGEIGVSSIALFAWYLFVFTGVYFFYKSTYFKVIVLLVSILLVQSIFIIEKRKFSSKKAFIVFHKSRHCLVGKRNGNKLLVNHNLDSYKFTNSNILKNYKTSEKIDQIKEVEFNNVVNYLEDTVLFVDSLGVYNIKGMKNTRVVLQFSPKVNLSRLIKTIKPSTIIADGSNYKSYIKHWKKVCLKTQVPFHYTGEKGAYILEK